jgi:hypothetical protein
MRLQGLFLRLHFFRHENAYGLIVQAKNRMERPTMNRQQIHRGIAVIHFRRITEGDLQRFMDGNQLKHPLLW